MPGYLALALRGARAVQ